MKLNQKGFAFSSIYIYAIVFLVIAGTIGYFYLSNKALRAKVEGLEARIAVLETANTGLEANLTKEREAKNKAIAFYQKKLNECIEAKEECELVVIPNCPTFVVIDAGDEKLELLKNIWSW
jgi:hypothetical protein